MEIFSQTEPVLIRMRVHSNAKPLIEPLNNANMTEHIFFLCGQSSGAKRLFTFTAEWQIISKFLQSNGIT